MSTFDSFRQEMSAFASKFAIDLVIARENTLVEGLLRRGKIDHDNELALRRQILEHVRFHSP